MSEAFKVFIAELSQSLREQRDLLRAKQDESDEDRKFAAMAADVMGSAAITLDQIIVAARPSAEGEVNDVH